eukprot:CAMPEP_0194334696 /NCGR_PEP_ID=MMETSP0171-20130528/67006_1 /TAXON_ID=218684 /ORGANISM="Corethron pennatum, Strain L29A3" /LENGTH=248 /DNA_ID=CAMNT_0039097469 /DNA_START=120 /DNA_END=866 /DNA_ORIENTATION=+
MPSKSAVASSTAGSSTMPDPADPLSRTGLPTPLLLGSGSFTRKLILKEMGIPFHLTVRSIDEKGVGDRGGDARDLVKNLSNAKMDALVEALRDGDPAIALPDGRDVSNDGAGWVVLTADQVVTHAGSILEKPADVGQAREFVARYASSPPATVGAVTLCHVPSEVRVTGVDSATIHFAAGVAEDDLVGRLLDDGAPVLSCAGGLMVEHPLVREHIDRIDGTEASVMGLSKELVLELLGELKTKLDENK